MARSATEKIEKISDPHPKSGRKQDRTAGHPDRRWCAAPFVLRVTEWNGYTGPVLVASERKRDEGASRSAKLQERGVIWGESLRRCLPVIRRIISEVCDESGVPMNLQRVFGKDGITFRGNLPLDQQAGSKMALLFKLQERTRDLDRAELIALRIEKFTREEAFYWISRITHFGPTANRWAISGMRLMLAGEPGDPEIGPMLEKIRP